MLFFSWLEQTKKARLWLVGVMVSVLLTEIVVSIMGILLKGNVPLDYLVTGLVASSFVATFVIGLVGYFLERLINVQEDNDYLNSIILKLDLLNQALHDSDEAYHTILATSLDGFWLISADGQLLDVNQRYCELSGYSREELLSMRIADLEAKESFEENAVHIQRVIENGGDQFDTIHRRKDGTFWHIEVSTIYSPAKGGLFYAFLRDITARKLAEKELRESQEMLRAISDNSNAMIFIKDKTSHYLFVNRLFETLFNVTSAEIHGKTDYSIFSKEFADKFTRDDKFVVESEQPFSIEETVPHKDGVHTYVTVKFPLRDMEGDVYAICGIATDITEYKRAEAALREHQEMLRAITDNTSTVIFIKDVTDHLLFVNKTFEELYHVENETIRGKTTYDVFPSDLAGKFTSDDQAVINSKQPLTIEEVVPNIDGDRFYITVKFPLRNVDGEIYAICGIATDITERKHAEIALQEQQEMLRAITDNSNAMIFIKDTQSNYLFVNQLFEQEFHVNNALIVGKNDYDVFPKEFADKFTANDRFVIKTGVPFSVEEVAPHEDGVHTYISVKFPLRKASGEIYGVCGIATDITERKKLEVEREQFFKFFNFARDLQCIFDLSGVLKQANPAVMETLGVSKEELLERSFMEFVVPEDRNRSIQALRNIVEVKLLTDFEDRCFYKDGSICWLSWQAIFSPDEGLVYAVGRDVTKRKQQEAQIQRLSESELNKAKLEAERANQAKSDFLSSMSHELFTPMNAVLGFAQILDSEELTLEQHEYIDAILTGGYKLLDLIKEVLDFSLVESQNLDLKQKQLDLTLLVQGSITLMQSLAGKKGIHIINTLTDCCHATVLADSLRLKQVLLNLLSNAIKYNRENGSITLSCEVTSAHCIKIKVTDTGPGLSAEQMAKLFQPFERLHAKNSAIEGAGLGLCISKRLIEAMNGKIGVESTVGEGSCFWIEIPLA